MKKLIIDNDGIKWSRINKRRFRINLSPWYTEFGGMQIHDYFSIFINNFPIIAIRRYMDCHSPKDFETLYISILIFEISINRWMEAEK